MREKINSDILYYQITPLIVTTSKGSMRLNEIGKRQNLSRRQEGDEQKSVENLPWLLGKLCGASKKL